MVSTVHGAFGKVSGLITYDGKDISTLSADVTIDATSISTNNERRDADLRSPNFFDVANHPTLTFKSKKATAAGAGKFKLVGDLTMHGVTKEVTLDGEGPTPAVNAGRNFVVGATATTTINRSEWGLTWNRALEAGGVTVSDAVKITLEIEANKPNPNAPPPPPAPGPVAETTPESTSTPESSGLGVEFNSGVFLPCSRRPPTTGRTSASPMTRLSTTSPTCWATSAMLVANASQAAALIWHALPDLNWAGFYFFDGAELVVGPFQGLPACTRIALTRGVCGAAASRRESIVVPDVHAFPGHIACDSRSRSELVVPIVAGGALRGVFDMDSPTPDRFDDANRIGVERLVAVFAAATAWPPTAGGAVPHRPRALTGGVSQAARRCHQSE